jgi:tetratricopeptide (TPR) repeat protein
VSDAEHFARPPEKTPAWAAAFLDQEAVETAARVAMSIDSPWITRVRSATPVVYEGNWRAERPSEPLAVPDAIECALQLCDALARLHAAGWTGLGVDLHDVCVHRDGGAWRVRVVVPHLAPRGRFSYAHLWHDLAPVRRDLCAVMAFLRDLLAGHTPAALAMWGDGYAYERLAFLALDDANARDLLDALFAVMATREAHAAFVDAASLAATLRPLARDPEAWGARIDAMPRGGPTALRRDWSRLIELGEAELATRPNDPYVVLPLAAAWHQRACAHFAHGDLDAAGRDLERCLALDPWCRYLTTRGTLRCARGDLPGALVDFTRAIDKLRIRRVDDVGSEAEFHVSPWNQGATDEGRRTLYARGVTRYRLGDLDGALLDLDDARRITWDTSTEGAETLPEFRRMLAQALVTVLRARRAAGVDIDRWDLVDELLACDRRDEALTEARAAIAAQPDDAKLVKRFRRRFGDAPLT